jgi:mRNA-degrading endonuclease RelE of RelBE toxin-antitoxin system
MGWVALEYMNRPIFRSRLTNIFRGQRTASLEGEEIQYGDIASASIRLVDLWSPNLNRICAPPREEGRPHYSQQPGSPRYKPREAVEDWHFGFGNSFRKAVDSIDRKLQGRILQALADIAESPVTNRGDTIKPLSGHMNGFWRYRIGDFRLVYYPDEATHTVTLCDFASRGSAYD